MAKVSKSEILYLLFWDLIMFGKAINLDGSNEYMRFITILAMFFVFFKIFLTKMKLRELLIVCMLLVTGFLTMVFSGREGLMLSVIAVVGMKQVDISNVFKNSLIIRVVALISFIFLSTVGIIENQEFYDMRYGEVDVVKYGFGLGHPNLVHSYFYIIVVMFLYLYFEKVHFSHYIIIVLFNLTLYRFTCSRTGLATVFLVLVLCIILKINRIRRFLSFWIKNIYWLCFGGVLLMIWLYDKGNSIAIYLDSMIIQGRLYGCSYYFLNYEVTLFGNQFGIESLPLDCTYIVLLLQYGVLACLIFLLISSIVVKRAWDSYNYKVVIVSVGFAIYMLFEEFGANIFLNVSILFWGMYLFDFIEKFSMNKTKVVSRN